MGEKKGVISKRVFLFFLISLFSVLASGCNTVAGASKGAAEGAKKDYEEAKKADGWMRDNLW